MERKMFTGLIEEIGTVENLSFSRGSLIAEYRASSVLEGMKIGDSIAVNGICQTVTAFSTLSFRTDISEETLSKTTARFLKRSAKVNLERAMCLGDRIGGHLVQGHINSIGNIKLVHRENSMYRIVISVPESLMKYMIAEGSIAIDGISLTTAQIDRTKNEITVQIIPHSYNKTVLQYRQTGDPVNIETDMIGRYVESLYGKSGRSNINYEKLANWGY